ncbi:hypothetical protein CEUSTIGMA_g10843.t1 [Chlamydomonas eustigma]|uniref:Glucosidase II subunit alpha n=1 Tax=Chlamydomonas eustigma TaxID=1157962 RepID=A0A250XK21_9CHLO|nr:hypothetical protein CEUSTIGMA_g10843.t1 [Chlamydomonas eustigma]|eukprot:GAX83418.1 hypothetical protein CEUSTIGMA_g10843.t1 [Chlamydomonas eustigma]
MIRWIVSSAIFAIYLLELSSGFKEHEFKKCKDTGFCRRHRTKSGPKFDVLHETASVSGHELRATLRNMDAGKTFNLIVRAHSSGTIRLLLDEDLDPSVTNGTRYRISPEDSVTLPSFETTVTPWKTISKTTKDIVVVSGDVQVTLTFAAFKMLVVVKGKPALSLNSKGLFDMEHFRLKEEGVECDGCWSETFLQFTDSKPHGPEAMSLDIAFPGFEHVYGLPEHATSFALKPTVGGEPYRLYNLDVFEYLDSSPFGLYGSIPMMVAHKVGLTIGVFWLNAAEMFVDVSKEGSNTATQWIAESGIVDLFIFTGPGPAEVQQQYAEVTGPTAMPQQFSVGYHQCRWNYKDEADVHLVDSGFDEHEIPYDVIWLDIEHTNGKRYLTWDSHLFPKPIELQNDVASRGRETVTIVDPHVKRDHSYYIFQEAQSEGYFVKNPQGGDFEGWCWPGSSSYLDVTNPTVRAWWAQQFALDKYQGSTEHLYIWNDMNEPSVFNGPEITMQKDLIHHGNVEHRDVHNLYGLFYHMGTAEGLTLRGYQTHGEDGDRPFVLSRAFFSGTQRVGPIWTGDNTADWKHLAVSIPMLLSLGVTGLPFSGADVGGFFGNPDAELITRWNQLGTYYPFFRGHAHLETQRREPWLFGEPATSRIRAAIRERYALMPYIYTLFRHANISGQPIMRPLWFEFPDAKELFHVEDSFLLGSAILVSPVLQQGVDNVDLVLPKGARWFNAHSGEETQGAGKPVKTKVDMESIPVYYKGGSIVPRRERPRRSTRMQMKDPFTLIVALDGNWSAAGDLYLDDGRSFAFLRGQYTHREFKFEGLKLRSAVHNSGSAVVTSVGSWAPAQDLEVERVVFLGLPKTGKGYTARMPDGTEVSLEAGAASTKFSQAENAWVLRQPKLGVDADWVVELVAHK